MRIYIAGPIRGYPQGNRPAFDAAKVMLRNQGHEPVSPFDFCTPEEEAATDVTPELCRRFARRDCITILDCDAIYMLAGWEKSVGATAEHAVAVWGRLYVYDVHRPLMQLSTGDPAKA